MNYGIVASEDMGVIAPAPPLNPYVASAVHFAGGPNLPDAPGTGPTYLNIVSLAATDNGLFSFSLWARDLTFQAEDFSSGNASAEWCVIDPTSQYAPEFSVLNDMKLQFSFTNSSIFTVRYAQLTSGEWHHLMGSINTNLAAGNKICAFYVDDELQSPVQEFDSDASFVSLVNGKQFVFGDDGAGYGPVCDFADVWIAPGVSLLTGSIIAESDRRKFIDVFGKPVDPVNFPSSAVLFTGDYSEFATNQGTGGSASLTGSLTAASTSPSGYFELSPASRSLNISGAAPSISVDVGSPAPSPDPGLLAISGGTPQADVAVVAFSASLGGPGAGIDGDSVRNVVPLAAVSGSQVRVTFRAQLNCILNNASVGVQSTTYNTGATPVELTFGGNHGFTCTSNNQVWISDWATLSISPSDIVVIVQDYGASSNHYYASGVSGTIQYRQDATASYNQSAPGGSWTNDGNYTSVEKVELK